jgi:amino acid adenylation domain-containing protein/non-ribosomal peptide synthase protein (TIGR01720 family)
MDVSSDTIKRVLQEIVEEILGVDVETVGGRTSFIEMGADSLLLLQMSQAIQKRLGVKVPFRALLEEYAYLDALLDHVLTMGVQAGEESGGGASVSMQAEPVRESRMEPTEWTEGFSKPPVEMGDSSLEQLLIGQLRILSEQLSLLAGTSLPPSPHNREREESTSLPSTDRSLEGQKEFVPVRPISRTPADGLDERQRQHLAAIIERLVARTPTSKQMAERYRSHLADDRASARFRVMWKEMLYPIVFDSGAGSRIRDIDGNEYVDLTMGFGSLLFGHNPPFVVKTLEEQLTRGLGLGFQSPLAGEAATLIAEMTGMERVAFCNSGTEAVMSAIRLARTKTGRNKIAMFSGAYHGFSDEVLVRRMKTASGDFVSTPVVPGIASRVAQDVEVLEYGSEASLAYLRAHASEFAAVLIEPLQSRRHHVDPAPFLRALRTITAAADTALIFDEVVTGFRMHPGGMQAIVGVQADLCTYGKCVGGGIPIGIVAGKAEYMDGLDGGVWQYGDQSYPQKETTFLAGTYFKHPLTIPVIHAVLTHLKEAGPQLQERLRQQTARLVERINDCFHREQAPIRVTHYGPLFQFHFDGEVPYPDLFFFHLLEKGVYVWEGRICYLSTAHTEEDLDHIVRAVKLTVKEMRQGGFLPPPDSPEPNQREALPLTEEQKGIWSMTQMGDGASKAFHLRTQIRLRGSLQVDALKKSLEEVVRRHEALRMTIAPDGSQQMIHPPGEIEWSILDGIEGLEEPVSFDLSTGPLYRFQLYRLAPEDFLFILTLHHIVADGLSVRLLVEEIRTLYSAHVEGKAPALQEPASYREYVLTQAERLRGPEGKAAEAFWLKQHESGDIALELPADRRQEQRSYRGGRVQTVWDQAFVKRLREWSIKQDCTLYISLLSGFQTLVHRLTGRESFVVATPSDGRFLWTDQPLVADCINMLPLRVHAGGQPSVRQFVKQTKHALLDALEHRQYSFRNLMKRLGLLRQSDRPPLVTIVFNLEPMGDAVPFAGLETEIVSELSETVPFDISLHVFAGADQLLVQCDYAADLFREETVEQWLGFYRYLLEGMMAAPDQPLARIPLMTDAMRQTILFDWNRTKRAYPRDRCLHHLVEAQSRLTPDGVAVATEEDQMTYAALHHRSNQVARMLIDRGLTQGQRLGLCMDRSVEMIPVLLGILKAGCAYVPLDPSYPQERLSWIIQDSGIACILTEPSCIEGLPDTGTHRICLAEERDRLLVHTCLSPLPAVPPEMPAYVIYTSGSTGKPKGIEVSHQSVVNFLCAMQREPGLHKSDVLLAVTTLSFDISVLEIFLPLSVGARLVLVNREISVDGKRLADWLMKTGATVMQATPATWRMLVEAGWKGLENLTVLSGGEAITNTQAEAMRSRGASLWNLYGPTECTVWSTRYRVKEEAGDWISIGTPIDNMNAYVLDEALEPVPVGVRGELYLAGSGLAHGYAGNPRKTAAAFLPHPYSDRPGARMYKTGDSTWYRPDGTIGYAGRIDDQVKIRGYRVEPGEIEAVLVKHPAVRECVVVARSETPGVNALVAYIVPADGKKATVTALRNHLATQLPEYMLPAVYVMLDALPLTPNGKVNRAALPAPDNHRPELEQTYVPPRTRLEKQLAKIWQELLHVQKVGVWDDFFELGGDSITAVQMVARVNQLGLQLEPIQLFRQPTIADLIHEVGDPESLPILLTPTQHRFFTHHGSHPHEQSRSIWLSVHRKVSAAQIKQVFYRLVDAADIFQLRFQREDNGWKPFVTTAPETAFTVTVVDCQGIPAEERQAMRERITAPLRKNFHLEHGPLLHGVFFQTEETEKDVLFLAVHSLVLDQVSWERIVGDIEQLTRMMEQGKEGLPPVWEMPSVRVWANRLQRLASSESIRDETGFWLKRPEKTASLPLDMPGGENTGESAQILSVTFPEEETRRLLQVSKNYRIGVDDVLLAALTLLVQKITPGLPLVLDRKAGGRLSHTAEHSARPGAEVFSVFYPLLLDMKGKAAPEEVLQAVREQVRSVPGGGIGYGLLCTSSPNPPLDPGAEILFQYEEIGSSTAETKRLFSLCEPGLSLQYSSTRRRYLLEVHVWIANDQLQMDWVYSSELHQEATIAGWVQSFAEAFRGLIQDEAPDASVRLSPSDFPVADVDQADLDRIMEELEG